MSKLLIDERPLTVLPSLVALVGMERAVILQQIHWLSQQKNTGVVLDDGHKWVWGTNEEWCEEYFTFWEPDTLRKHLNKLSKDGYIFTCQPNGFNRTNHYRINMEKIDEAEAAMRHDHAGSKRHKRTTSMRHDDATSNGYDHTASKRKHDATSIRHDDAASYNEKTSTETTTETSQKRDVGLTPTPPPHPDAWPDFLAALCWTCYAHKDVDALTDAQRGALTAEAKKIYDAGYTMSDLRRWMEDRWFNDFRWKRDRERPRPDIVRSSIPCIRDEHAQNADYYGPYRRTHTADGDDSEFAEADDGIVTTDSSPLPTRQPDPWTLCLRELEATLPRNVNDWLRNSQLLAAGEIADEAGNKVPLYQVAIHRSQRIGLDWLQAKVSANIRKRLSSILGHPILVEIVLAEAREGAVV